MKKTLLLTVLLLVIPMALLNPLGRPAFLGYYAGIAAAWIAALMCIERKSPVKADC